VTWAGDATVEDKHRIALAIKDFSGYKREMLGIAEEALAAGRTLAAATYFRGAEFFMTTGDPDKGTAYD